ncbi:DUF4331 domain-containing protein [Amycolatopsis sp. PS_44_ISF1]|uniref:DUF4331 domain-containing protein n=1 Tax=Amycolatopsis sp. PS_44_ISF1 TaxID=2974917 RepID=UPI0028DE7EE2|nr:DUF4331 domain-containing protein [Amycolatopsis sp. PS_44_ISF1]MDT8912030.1 DUF4331 domain-containing protein [Amycolatopsis sp. PS_44_ISF1]
MSSHKEAPGIVNDAAADNTDVYAFVSPDKPDTVTLIANFIPLEDPDGGPNFFEFGDDVLYEIHVSNSGTATADISYQFRFRTEIRNEKTFLYNTGPITSLDSPNWNRRQFYSMTKVDRHGTRVRGGVKNAACPPCNIGPASTPDYPALAAAAVTSTELGGQVFAGQRAEGFYVDLGAIFDLGDLRPFQNLNVLNKMPAAPGVNSTAAKNIHSIVLQVPKTHLSEHCSDPANPQSTIGVWATASRQKTRLYNTPLPGEVLNVGPFEQISRLGNPLVNEVLIPLGRKDLFNSQQPHDDKQFADRIAHPELATLLPVLYPGVFPNLDKLNKSGAPRADLEAVLLTGIPAGLIPGFQNYTGATQADMLRLNLAIPPTTQNPSNLGLIGGDAAGYPNGRRVFDDVTTIELRAIAGAIYPLVDKTYTPDAAAGAITPGLTSSNTDVTADNTVHYLPSFPYLGTPHSGYETKP